ncbi:MAG: hypothetical protein ACLFPL_04095 [Candidatus Nanoarchaeia archaeon]
MYKYIGKTNHARLSKISVAGSNVNDTKIYKDYVSPTSIIEKIFVIHNHLYGVEIFNDGSLLVRQSLGVEKESSIVMEIYTILNNASLVEVSKEWERNLLEF